jgi:hypothetical protein
LDAIGYNKTVPPFLLEKRQKMKLPKTSVRNSGQYRSEAGERYELNAIDYLLKSIEFVWFLLLQIFKDAMKKFIVRTETGVATSYS